MTDVVISKKRLFSILLLIALLVLAFVSLPFLQRFLPSREAATVTNPPAITPTPDVDQPAKEAVLAGAQAFYTVDYLDQQGWLKRLCAVSTQIGCAVDQNVLAPSLWDGFFQNKTVTTVQVQIENKVLDQVQPTVGGDHAQIWQVQIELSAPWPQQTRPLTSFPALALVFQGLDGWKFERFLTEEEASQYQKGAQK